MISPFDPPTPGHLALGELALAKRLVNEVIFMPCYAHRFKPDLEFPFHRYYMCDAMVRSRGNHRLVVSKFEIKLQQESVTYDVLTKFKEAYPHVSPHVIVGLDNALSIHTWLKWEELTAEFPFIVFPREGVEDNPKITWFRNPPHKFIADCEWRSGISSTKIRTMLFEKDPQVKTHLHPKVLKYIQEYGLYSPERKQRREAEAEKVKKRSNPQ